MLCGVFHTCLALNLLVVAQQAYTLALVVGEKFEISYFVLCDEEEEVGLRRARCGQLLRESERAGCAPHGGL